MVRKIIVVGGGSAGFMAAAALKFKIPQVEVVVIRSPEIGIIGVGEGSGVPFTQFVHDFLGIPVDEFVRKAKPSWKLGTNFIWGPRKRFFFPFGPTLDFQVDGLSKPTGFYCKDDLENASIPSAMMAEGRMFERASDGSPLVRGNFAYHIENEMFAAFLEELAVGKGVRIVTDTIRNVRQDERGIAGLDLASGATETADLYVDCSGFRSLLLGKTFNEPFVSYASTLFCDRAVVGGWSRTDEPIHPYTTAETMDSGWAWQIEHPNRVNRGYVYSSAFISDEEAEREFRLKNPKVGPTRMVKFVSGRYERHWVKNVVAIGNAGGFVEPLEATALAIHATRSALLTELLLQRELEPCEAMAGMFNNLTNRVWDCTRQFLATHYRFNTRLDTPFWRQCREHTDMAGCEPIVDWYQQMGPTPYGAPAITDRLDIFGMDGYLTTLLGQCVPHQAPFVPSPRELAHWKAAKEHYVARARQAMTVNEALDWFLHPEKHEPKPPVQYSSVVVMR